MSVENADSAKESEQASADEVTQDAQVVTEGSEAAAQETKGAEGEEKPEDTGELEVVLEGEEEEAPTPHKVPRRIRKLLANQTKMQGEAVQADEQSQKLLQENEALKAQIAQAQPAQPPSTMPIAPVESNEDIDYDPEKLAAAQAKYAQDMESWFSARQTQTVQTQAQEAQHTAVQEQENAALTVYYDKAENLKIPDFDKHESALAEAWGENGAAGVKAIATTMSNGHLIVNYLGKNTDKAMEIADLSVTNPNLAKEMLYELNFKLKTKPRKSETPDPEQTVEGGGAGAGDLQSQVDKALEAGNIDEYRKLKKEAKAQKYTLK